MALVLAQHPELEGHKAFLTACNCGPTTLNPETGFHHVNVHGVVLRISKDQEYIVEQDLYASRKNANMVDKKAMTAAAYRVRAAYSTTRRESQVGDHRLQAYREWVGDAEAKLFYAKSRALGGKTPPPVMAISIVRYYVNTIGVEALGLNLHPEFVELVNGLELLPGCPLDEVLHTKVKKAAAAPSSDSEDEPATEGAESAPPVPTDMKKLKKKNHKLQLQLASMTELAAQATCKTQKVDEALAEIKENLAKLTDLVAQKFAE
jgi:hypothetical protein